MVDKVKVMDNSDQQMMDTSGQVSKSAAAKSSSIPRGKPKSGRFWKEPKQRASSIKRCPRDNAIKKMKDRVEKKRVQELSITLRHDIAETARIERERRAEAKKVKDANIRKSEIVQTIKDTRKIKKMKKKQLRLIEKRDTTVVETT